MAFKNFIYTEDDDDLAFLPKEPSSRFGIGSPSASVNTELPKDAEEPKVQPAEITADSGESLKAVNKRAREFLKVIEKMSGEANVIKARKRVRRNVKSFESNVKLLWRRYQVTLATLESKVDSLEAKKAKLEAVKASLRREVEELKQDRRDVVSKVVPYDVMELVHSDELGRLVGMLVSSTITYGRCREYEQEDLGLTPLCALSAKAHVLGGLRSDSFMRFISEGSCVALNCGQMYCATFTRSEGSCVALSCGQMYCATFTRRFPLGT
nr:hypothetical protein [Tanacetum cinerariifolium]